MCSQRRTLDMTRSAARSKRLAALRDTKGIPLVLDDNLGDWEGDKPGSPLFVVMEWIDGVTLHQFAKPISVE